MYLTTFPVDVNTMFAPPESDAISTVNVQDANPVVPLLMQDLVALSCVHVDASFDVSVPVVAVYRTQ